MNFKKYLKNLESPGIVFIFGRLNPITETDSRNFQELQNHSKKYKMDSAIYTSWIQNKRKNPLSVSDKLQYIKKIIPENVQISNDHTLNSAFDVLKDLINKNYKRIIFLVNEDQLNSFQGLKKYAAELSDNEVTLEIKTMENNNTSDMLTYAKNDDFTSFNESLPQNLTNQEKIELFDKVKKGIK